MVVVNRNRRRRLSELEPVEITDNRSFLVAEFWRLGIGIIQL